MRRLQSGLLIAALGIAIGGCVTDIAKTSQREILVPGAAGPALRLAQSVSVDLPRGYSTDDLMPNTHWSDVGSIPEGRLFKPVDTSLVVKAGPRYDGYLVVKDNLLMGVYLPTESASVTLSPPAVILLTANP